MDLDEYSEKTVLNNSLKKAAYILIALLLIDIAFLVLHYFNHYYKQGFLRSVNFIEVIRLGKVKTRYYFSVAQDGGFGEMFQYFKFVSASLILIFLAIKMRSKFLLLWSALAFFLFLEDWLKIHEWVGGDLLGDLLAAKETSSDASYDFGQLIYAIIITAFICAIGLIFWWRSSADCKALSMRLLISLGALWVSAVVVDALRDPLDMHYYLGLVLEEGGEHIAASFFLYFCILWMLKINGLRHD